MKLDHQGNAEVIRYIGSQQLAVEAFQGNLSSDFTNRVFATSNKAFEEALHDQSYTSGLTQGDQFHLVFVGENKTYNKIFGFVHLAPKVVSSTVAELLKVVKHLNQVPLATAYLKSEPISNERFTQLQSSGLVKNFETLPTKLREILQSAIDKPYTFVTLNNTQYQHFLVNKLNSELFLNKQGNGYQIELFRADSLTKA
ncbi:hypothetical protein ACE1AT_03190 [Pelatocladus sp. BLCC-F211]|uniref:hypothetical protein n=1 Tax=Pelatocladus sp. BLCC-F211 TaxID=3342752 RepID=UPI0035BA4E34